MAQPNLKKNAFYNFLRIFLNTVTPLITFPYAARILAPEGIGNINFANSVANYFLLIANLGIPLYAMRAVARVRNDMRERTQLFCEFFVISLITTGIMLILYGIMIFSISPFKDQLSLYLIFASLIFFTPLGVTWMYQGLEDYRFITILNMIFKVLAIGFLFLFIKEKNDILLYAVYVVLISVGSSIVKLIRIFKKIDLSLREPLDLKRHMKGIFLVFSLTLAGSLYLHFDKIMLGALASYTAVGLYTAANKLVKTVKNLQSSVSAVLVPRYSYYAGQGDDESFARLARKSLSFVFLFSLPAISGLVLLGPELITLFAGKEFLSAGPVLLILSPIILLIGLSNFTGSQILYSRNKEKIMIVSSVSGAAVNLGLNFLLIPSFGAFGAGTATLAAEALVLGVQLILGRKFFPRGIVSKEIVKYIAATAIMVIFLIIVREAAALSGVLLVVFSVPVGMAVYGGVLIIMKEKVFLPMVLKKMKRG